MISAILLAGGIGSRVGASIPKQYLPLLGIPIAIRSLSALLSYKDWAEIIVVCGQEYQSYFLPFCQNYPLHFAPPGKTRADSAISGINSLSTSPLSLCIHDAARPLLLPQDLQKLLEAGRVYEAATLAVKTTSTIKQADPFCFVDHTLDRSLLWEVQTPQVIRTQIFKEGYRQFPEATDDVFFAEKLGVPVKLVEGSYSNLKITTPEDLLLAEILLEQRTHG